MPHDLFDTIDSYIDDLFVADDPILQAAETRMLEAGLPAIHISRGQGQFLYLLALIHGAKRILEIGTLGGYSSIWLARALPEEGKLVTLEVDPHHSAVAKANFQSAGLQGRIEILTGPALATLADLQSRGEPPFDLVFLDADKLNYNNYLEASLKLVRPGGLIVADNVIRAGAVLDPDSSDESAVGAARFNKALAAHPRLESIVLQQVGIKGHDGLAIARIRV